MANYKLKFRDGFPPRCHTFIAQSAAEALTKIANNRLGQVIVMDAADNEIAVEELRRLAMKEKAPTFDVK